MTSFRSRSAVLVAGALIVGAVSLGLATGPGGRDLAAAHNRPKPTPTASPKPSPAASPTPAPSATPSPSLAPSPTPSAPPSGFVTRVGTKLALNGAPFTFTGLNLYNANSRNNCWYSLGNNDSALANSLSASRIRTMRAWFFQREATTNGVRDWAAFDHTLAVAKAANVKVVATLFDTGGTCDSGTWHYTDWFATGYRSPTGTDLVAYRDYVAQIVARYANDPTILAWQIGNEMEIDNSTGGCGPAATLDAFVNDIAGLIKSIDSHHLVSVGTMGSGQCGAQGSAEYQALHSSPAVDLCEYHDYSAPSVAVPGDQWNGLAVRISDCAALGKPLFVGEAGIAATDPNRASEVDNKISGQFAAGTVGFLSWEWRAAGITDGDSFVIGPSDPVLAVLASH